MLRFMEGFEHCGDDTATAPEIAARLATKWDVVYAESANSFMLTPGYMNQGMCFTYNEELILETRKGQLIKVLDNQTHWVVGFAFRQYTPVVTSLLCGMYSLDRLTVYLDYGPTSNSYYSRLLLKRLSGEVICSVDLLKTEEGIPKWYYIEFKATIDPINGSAELRVDGVSIGSGAGLVTGYSDIVGADRIQFVNTTGNYLDDIYVLDGQTPGATDFLGKSKVSTLYPVQDAGPNNWAPSQIGDHYAVVNDPILDMNSYLYTNDDNASEQFSFGVIPGSGVIYGAQLTGQFAVTGSQPKVAKIMCSSNSSETTLEQTIAQPDNHTDIVAPLETDPGTGNTWERSNLNIATFGVEKVS